MMMRLRLARIFFGESFQQNRCAYRVPNTRTSPMSCAGLCVHGPQLGDEDVGIQHALLVTWAHILDVG